MSAWRNKDAEQLVDSRRPQFVAVGSEKANVMDSPMQCRVRFSAALTNFMKPTILTDWDTIRIYPVIDGVEYAVEAEIHVTTKQEPPDYSVGPEETANAELQGWWSEPPVQSTEHEQKIIGMLMEEMEEKYQ